MRILVPRSWRWWVVAGCIAWVGGCAATPPVAKKVPQRVSLGGDAVVDNYWWLRNKADSAVTAYLKAENAYTDAAMKPATALEERLYKEMVARIRETDESAPNKDGDWWYSRRTEAGKQYPIYLRRRGSPTATAQVVTDVNQLAAGHPFFEYEPGHVSDDGNLLAYSTDITGNRQYLLQIKDLRSGTILKDQMPLVESFEWAADSKAFYYVKEDEAKRGFQLYRHRLGSPVYLDDLVYEEADAEFSIKVSRTRDRKFLRVESESKTATEVRVIAADREVPPLVLIEPRKSDQEYYVDHRGGRFYIRVNDTGRNFRIVTAPDGTPGSKNWTELVPARPDVVLDDQDLFAHHLVITERRDGLPQLAIAPLPGDPAGPAAAGTIVPREVAFDEPDFTVGLSDNAEFDPPSLRFYYTSLTTPKSVFDLDWATGKRTLLKQEPVGGGFDPANYREERLFATASDGTKIPISLVYRRSPGASAATTRPAAPRPALLEGYGAYGISNDVYFWSTRLSLLDRGMIYAVAHVRGGGEYGRAWYDAGRMKNKPNTFTDFIAAAEFLEKQGYTTPNQLAIEGASAGGLLIGAVLNQKPQLFHAAMADVPWVDVLADMCDPSIPLTTLEYTEWGNPNIPAERAIIAAYCPVTNVRPQAYPKLLVRESINDSQVQYWDAARWVARLRAAKKSAGDAGKSELLLKMDMDAGHAGASGRYSEIHDAAFDDAWLLTRLGVEK